jgi:hypothetical protein
MEMISVRSIVIALEFPSIPISQPFLLLSLNYFLRVSYLPKVIDVMLNDPVQ